MSEYLESIKNRDPAARSILSIILTYPGVKAILFHRIANFFHIAGFHLVAPGNGSSSFEQDATVTNSINKIGKNLFIFMIIYLKLLIDY
jgi:serine O-acetyltransferase